MLYTITPQRRETHLGSSYEERRTAGALIIRLVVLSCFVEDSARVGRDYNTIRSRYGDLNSSNRLRRHLDKTSNGESVCTCEGRVQGWNGVEFCSLKLPPST